MQHSLWVILQKYYVTLIFSKFRLALEKSKQTFLSKKLDAFKCCFQFYQNCNKVFRVSMQGLFFFQIKPIFIRHFEIILLIEQSFRLLLWWQTTRIELFLLFDPVLRPSIWLLLTSLHSKSLLTTFFYTRASDAHVFSTTLRTIRQPLFN